MAEYLYRRTQERVSGKETSPSSPPGMERVIFRIPGSGITSQYSEQYHNKRFKEAGDHHNGVGDSGEVESSSYEGNGLR